MRIQNEPLDKYTTFKIGGNARFYSVCNNVDELRNNLIWAKQKEIPYFILGNGSNILISDEGFLGLVIKLKGDFNKITICKDKVKVGAGVLLPKLSRYLMEKGWGGFEYMCDIPGTIGGAVRINAGTKEGEIKDTFLSTSVLDADKKIKTIIFEGMKFSYRNSSLTNSNNIILSVNFKKNYEADKTIIKNKIDSIIKSRRKKQPKIRQNAGSIFKSKPIHKSAGWYIERAGLKGFRIGNAIISKKHANWIVNIGGAKASDVKSMISYVQEIVNDKFGIKLEREVIYVPEDLNS